MTHGIKDTDIKEKEQYGYETLGDFDISLPDPQWEFVEVDVHCMIL